MTSSIKELPLLSVIVPAYNSENTIYDCIQSICRQTYKNLEIIVIDDGSTDKTYEILCELKEHDKRIKLLRQKNSGPAKARNEGLKNAEGDLLAFVDSDDTIESEMYEIMYGYINKRSCDIVVCNVNCYDTANKKTFDYGLSKFGEFDSMNVARSVILSDKLCGGGFTCNKLINYKKIKSVYGTDIFFNKNFLIYEDKCWYINILELSEKVCVIENKLYNYMIRPGSVSHDLNVNKIMTMLDAWDYLMEKSESLFDETEDIFRVYTEIYIGRIWKFRNHRVPRLLEKWKKLCKFKKCRKISLVARVQYIWLYLVLGKSK